MPRSEPSSGIVRWGDAPASSSSDECPEGGDGSEDCPYELDEIEPTVCENEEQTYDEETDECYCENGSDEPDCYLEEGEPTDPEDDDPDCDFEPCGGSDPDDPDGCDPEEEICDLCGDERDVMIQEYEDRGVAWTPTCEDLEVQNGSPNFSWTEYNGRWEGGNESTHEPYGYVAPTLQTGMEATRTHYDKGAIYLESGYRCPDGNIAIGSDVPTTSRHLFGRAADVYSMEHENTQTELNLLQAAADEAGASYSYTTMDPIHVHAQWE